MTEEELQERADALRKAIAEEGRRIIAEAKRRDARRLKRFLNEDEALAHRRYLDEDDHDHKALERKIYG